MGKIHAPPGFLVAEASADGVLISDFTGSPAHLRFLATQANRHLNQQAHGNAPKKKKKKNERGKHGTGINDNVADGTGNHN